MNVYNQRRTSFGILNKNDLFVPNIFMIRFDVN